MLKLYEHPLSPYAQKVKIALYEKGIPFTAAIPNLFGDPESDFLGASPRREVPSLIDGDFTVFDSTVIDEYLDERYPEPPLMPSSAVERAMARQLEQFGDEAILIGNLPLIWMPYWSEPAKRDLERMEKGREGLRKRDFPYLEQVLGSVDADSYIRGSFSLADVPLMALAMVLEVDAIALADFPRLERYLSKLRARPSYRAISPSTPVSAAAGRSQWP